MGDFRKLIICSFESLPCFSLLEAAFWPFLRERGGEFVAIGRKRLVERVDMLTGVDDEGSCADF